MNEYYEGCEFECDEEHLNAIQEIEDDVIIQEMLMGEYKTHKPEKSIVELIKKQELIEPCENVGYSKRIDLPNWIFGSRLMGTLYRTEKCEIIEKTDIICSWYKYLVKFQEKGYITGFKIKNIDENRSVLKYSFNPNHIRPEEYDDYTLRTIYCIDNNIDAGKQWVKNNS